MTTLKTSIIFTICLYLLSEILEADSDDPLVIIDQQNVEEETRLPNSHSASFVMAFIFLCLLLYGAYRVCRCHCMHKKPPLTVNLDAEAPSELEIKGLEKYIKEHDDYLAIYGPKKQDSNLHVCEFKRKESSSSTR
ncbi:uncharacterized protein NPIL_148631 [Nephila pilipes]|uniref:Uncharacterized protein n=1 Tax=Nephila pilipes TaxID=299642 RepID=A0A8X6PZA7_NEPPI|nr:uncharacterized protein NPIL_148631 [Nephila pilipes]